MIQLVLDFRSIQTFFFYTVSVDYFRPTLEFERPQGQYCHAFEKRRPLSHAAGTVGCFG